jgi:hypothetical protein
MEDDPVVMARLQDMINTFFANQYPQNVQVTQWPQLKENLKETINSEFPEIFHIQRINFRDFLIQAGR